MFKLFERGSEYNKLAKAIGSMHFMLQELMSKIELGASYSDLNEEMLVIAYVAKKGVMNRLVMYSWPMDGEIIVPTIDPRGITLEDALDQTVGIIQLIASDIGMLEIVNEFMEGGPSYSEFDKLFPDHLKNKI